MENVWKIINCQAHKVVVFAYYRRWSFTRGSNCKDLTGKILVFWTGGRLSEVVDMEVRLYSKTSVFVPVHS